MLILQNWLNLTFKNPMKNKWFFETFYFINSVEGHNQTNSSFWAKYCKTYVQKKEHNMHNVFFRKDSYYQLTNWNRKTGTQKQVLINVITNSNYFLFALSVFLIWLHKGCVGLYFCRTHDRWWMQALIRDFRVQGTQIRIASFIDLWWI